MFWTYYNKKYVMDILQKANMLNCKPFRAPKDKSAKFSRSSLPIYHPNLFHKFFNLPYSTQEICLFMHDLHEPYFTLSIGSLGTFIALLIMTLGYYVFLFHNLFSWSSKHQGTLYHASIDV
uniref:Uncharacterized protein n=1 Tax=Lactuca sativa TaxID=4236 RepID=A0A9R1VEG2_LACSA|nr:hypothetical protein LSAT_V11C500270840 [Lactuca sativa]